MKKKWFTYEYSAETNPIFNPLFGMRNLKILLIQLYFQCIISYPV